MKTQVLIYTGTLSLLALGLIAFGLLTGGEPEVWTLVVAGILLSIVGVVAIASRVGQKRLRDVRKSTLEN